MIKMTVEKDSISVTHGYMPKNSEYNGLVVNDKVSVCGPSGTHLYYGKVIGFERDRMLKILSNNKIVAKAYAPWCEKLH